MTSSPPGAGLNARLLDNGSPRHFSTPARTFQLSVASLEAENVAAMERDSTDLDDTACSPEELAAVQRLCNIAKVLAIVPYFENERMQAFHSLIMGVLTGWCFIGWLIRLGYAAASIDMPMIPGWFEVSAADNSSILSSLFLCGNNLFTWLCARWYFRQNMGYLKTRMVKCKEDCPGAPSIAPQLRRSYREVIAFGIIAPLSARTANILIGVHNDANFLTTENPMAVFYDMVVALVSFSAQWTTVMFLAQLFRCICQVHRVQLRLLGNMIHKGVHNVEQGLLHHRRILCQIRSTAAKFTTWLTVSALLSGLGTVLVLLNVLFQSSKKSPMFLFRLTYCALDVIPVIVVLGTASSVSTEGHYLFKSVCRKPPKDEPTQVTLFYTYLSNCLQNGEVGFAIFDQVITKKLLLRISYLLGLLLSTGIQYRFRTSA